MSPVWGMGLCVREPGPHQRRPGWVSPPLPSLPTSLVLEAAARMAARMLRRAWMVGVGATRVFSNKTRGTFSQQ